MQELLYIDCKNLKNQYVIQPYTLWKEKISYHDTATSNSKITQIEHESSFLLLQINKANYL